LKYTILEGGRGRLGMGGRGRIYKAREFKRAIFPLSIRIKVMG
jgi:hypothetical protein